ncbi:MAG: ORF6N domain-containing protein [Candidatus Omnitrophica bacterium]|nr:ORF6N domain-containing protein [Candidatus Omnitrophota bacterium]
MKELITQEVIEAGIFIVRGHKVMLSTHLADLYDVEAKVLIQAVKRNMDRFPKDFIFQLTEDEYKILKSQFVTSSWGGIRRANPYAFTEQGVAMLSSVLNSKRAVQVNIAIMRAFVRLRDVLSNRKELTYKLKELESKIEKHDADIQTIFEAIRQLMAPPPEKPRRMIGFKQE